MNKAKTISAYIKGYEPETQKRLKQMVIAIRSVVPKDTTEGIKYGMPAFYGKRVYVIFGGFNHHIGFYPTPSPIKTFTKELAKYQTAKGSIQLPLDKPLPLALIKKITKLRVNEVLGNDKKWKSSKNKKTPR